ncbi:zinc-ribbon domain-containing protein [Streptomyces swartbergensis]|uniref:zinc-ribbon domain-containing protein n=1 Tax=Streptomyces swartbergensis TaxID=487165 RepID=UPI003808B63C
MHGRTGDHSGGPGEVTAGADVPVWWPCPAGHEPWSAQVAHVFMGRQGCPRCRKRTHVSRQATELFAEPQHVLTGAAVPASHCTSRVSTGSSAAPTSGPAAQRWRGRCAVCG